MRVISREEVESLPLRDVVDSVYRAFRGFLDPGVDQPPRSELLIEGGSRFLGAMPCHIREYGVYTLKVVDYPFDGRPFNAYVFVYDLGSMEPLCIVDGVSITVLRTAGMALVSTIELYGEPENIGLIGVGRIGRASLEMHLEWFPGIRRVYLHNRGVEKAVRYAEELGRKGVEAYVASSPGEVVERAEVVILATTSSRPVIDSSPRGRHIASMGYMGRDSAELDPRLVASADKVFIDSPDLYEVGEVGLAIREGLVSRDAVHLFSELVLGSVAGRVSRDELTIFKSVGTAVQDGYLAYTVYRRLSP